MNKQKTLLRWREERRRQEVELSKIKSQAEERDQLITSMTHALGHRLHAQHVMQLSDMFNLQK